MPESLITSDHVFDGAALVAELNLLLRLRTTPVGMKMFETREEMEQTPWIRRPGNVHTTDQIVGQAARNGWTVGITMDDLVGAQCGAVIGLHPRSEEWLSGDCMAGVWYENQVEAAKHQAAMDLLEYGRYEAMAVSPLASMRLSSPDIRLTCATPAQMILFINGLGGPATKNRSSAVWANHPAPIPGAGRSRRGGRACSSPVLPSDATAGPGRRTADGDSAGVSAPDYCGPAGAIEEPSALPDTALWRQQ